MSRLFSIFCFVFLVSTSSLIAQKDVNSYKYIVVPLQYEFQKSEDQYDINSLTKFLFEKENFTVLLTSESYPSDLAANPCLALKAVLKKNSSFLNTKIVIDLVDCYNNVVYSSVEGTSRIKDYKKSYQEAVRNAFVSIQSLNYQYDGSVRNNLNVVVQEEPVAVSSVKNEKTVTPTVSTETAEVEVVETTKMETTKSATKTVQNATEATAVVATVPVAVSETTKDIVEVSTPKLYSIEGTYFIDMWGKCVIAPKGKGYSVVGGDENYEFAIISKTSKPTIFMVKKTGFSQSQLLELDENGSLKLDTENGVKIFKRVE